MLTEEPYRWLEAIGNRREYVVEQLKGGSPVFAASLAEGILLLGVGAGQSKVFELFDRHALAGLGHPADIEKIRQAAIDAAHVEAFNRAPEDVTLRRLVGFGLSPQLKSNFEQLFSAPFLVELILAEVNDQDDVLMRLHYDGTFQIRPKGVLAAAGESDVEEAAQNWLERQWKWDLDRARMAEAMLQAWWMLTAKKNFREAPSEDERRAGWRAAISERVPEMGWLARRSPCPARFEFLTLPQLGL